MKLRIGLGLPLAVLAALATLVVIKAFERPPVTSGQVGYRGTGMVTVANPRIAETVRARQVVPEAPPAAGTDAPTARETYENVQVLGHLSVEQFGRIMVAMTEWIYPAADGDPPRCTACHVEGNFASDDVYQKIVARRMLQMVQHINAQWTSHVGETGVTCYTCHRGNAVPAEVWSVAADPLRARGLATTATGQNRAEPSIGMTSMPFDPFTPFLGGDRNIRVIAQSPLAPANRSSTQETEWTYSLMIHMSQALGVNCTFCHNTRSFADWDQSSPARALSWHALRMVRDINGNYVEPLRASFPRHRLGPVGDTLKVNCATCHQGVQRPLLGAPMLRDYPELRAPPAR